MSEQEERIFLINAYCSNLNTIKIAQLMAKVSAKKRLESMDNNRKIAWEVAKDDLKYFKNNCELWVK